MRKTEENSIVRQFQSALGLNGFTITCLVGTIHDDNVCRADCDFSAKTIIITKDTSFKKLSDEEKRSTLIHELIECRILWMEQKVQDKTESIIYEEREELVNELAKILEKLK